MSIELNEKVVSDVQAAASADEGLRERIRVLVMQALVERRAEPAAVKSVLRSALAGIDGGLAQRGVQAGSAVREAVKGLDEAVARSVFALQMALDEAWSHGRDYTENDVKDTVSTVQDLEEDILSTLKSAADDAKGWLKAEFTDLGGHLARTGTDTGAQVRDVMQRLNSRLASAAAGSGADVITAAGASRARLNEVASGILRGLADALDARAGQSSINPSNVKD